MTKKKLIWLVPAAILAMVAFIIVGGIVVRALWNWLLPSLFGFHQITFWQALGLLLLCRILFGGFRLGRGGHRSKFGRRMAERWEQMTPEEREKFRQSFRGRCGGFEPPTPTPTA